jgi:hypothetical protein
MAKLDATYGDFIKQDPRASYGGGATYGGRTSGISLLLRKLMQSQNQSNSSTQPIVQDYSQQYQDQQNQFMSQINEWMQSFTNSMNKPDNTQQPPLGGGATNPRVEQGRSEVANRATIRSAPVVSPTTVANPSVLNPSLSSLNSRSNVRGLGTPTTPPPVSNTTPPSVNSRSSAVRPTTNSRL